MSSRVRSGAPKNLAISGTAPWPRQLRPGSASLGGAHRLSFQSKLVDFAGPPVEKILASTSDLSLVNVSPIPRTPVLPPRVHF